MRSLASNQRPPNQHLSPPSPSSPQTERIHIKNIGVGALQFRFVPKLEESAFCKPWLSVTPPDCIWLEVSMLITPLILNIPGLKLGNAIKSCEDEFVFTLTVGRARMGLPNEWASNLSPGLSKIQ